MANFSKNESYTNQSFTHQYTGVDSNQLADSANQVLTKDGYKMIEGQLGNATYEKGNRTMRLLFGAFVKYSKIHVAASAGGDVSKLTVDRKTSGMSGGLIGMNQVKKELDRVAGLLSGI
jgi:hypothetical protein